MSSAHATAPGVDEEIEEPARLRRELERAERTVRELRQQLAERDDFIAIAGHELRNPIGGIVVNVTGMMFLASKDASTPAWLQGRLETLNRQARRFTRRATTLLDASRLAAGHATIERELLDFGAVVRGLVVEYAPEAARARCAVDQDIEAGIVGSWDRNALESIAGNLISNAIKYGAGAPVAVVVRATEQDVSLVVRDHGVGIAAEDQQRIFGRFQRAKRRTDRPGFGLGLWIARQLAVAHGGDISVESAPGRGSVFTMTLPR